MIREILGELGEVTRQYTVSVRGQIPPDLGSKIAEAHSMAIQQTSAGTMNAAPGKDRNLNTFGRTRV